MKKRGRPLVPYSRDPLIPGTLEAEQGLVETELGVADCSQCWLLKGGSLGRKSGSLKVNNHSPLAPSPRDWTSAGLNFP